MEKIAIIGAGGIGSTFAVQLAGAGHEVSVIARNKRLAQLQQRGGVETAPGKVVKLEVRGALDEAIAYDLVLVSVLAHQVDALLPALTRSAAKRIMFMFNTFDALEPLRAAVGPERFSFGFPAIMASVDASGVLHSSIQSRGLLTTVTDRALADSFTAAGIPAVVATDMQAWLRSHVAAVVPLIFANTTAQQRGAGISWREARSFASVMDECFDLVRQLGHEIIPAPVSVISRLPAAAKAALLWSATRSRAIRDNGAAAIGEAHALTERMIAAAPRDQGLPQLQRFRPA